MLVLSRKVGESISIGDDVVVTVLRITGTEIRLGVEAPRDVAINRRERLADEEKNIDLRPGSAGS